MIKYLGSKRRLVPVLGAMASAVGARTALDLFTGTTRVAQELQRRSAHVTAVDTARYSHVLARCYVETDAREVDADDLDDALEHLDALPPEPGYFTETFCERSRFFQPPNGARVDAIRDAIERDYRATPMYPILLTSLVEAADRVDSTTGVQMAYVKRWAARSYKPLRLRAPVLVPGAGTALRADACAVTASLGPFDFAYLDPPYNQHRYFTNYHIWETLVAWDSPAYYGVACKRVDAREPHTRSVFNSRREMPGALAALVRDVDASVVVLSYNDESWITLDDLRDMCAVRGAVEVLAVDSKRYVGAQIGVHDPRGVRVGTVSHLRNVEYLVVSGEATDVARVASAGRDALGGSNGRADEAEPWAEPGTARPEGANGMRADEAEPWAEPGTARPEGANGTVPGGGCDDPGVGGPSRLGTRGHGTDAARGAAGNRPPSAAAGRTGPCAPDPTEAVTGGAQ